MFASQPSSSGELCLERVDALRQEIQQAMAAISVNGLERLEESLWRQEMLCVGLKHLLPDLRALQPQTVLAGRLQDAMKALYELNRTYAEVVRQAQLSNHLLVQLSRNHSLSVCQDVGTGLHYSMEA